LRPAAALALALLCAGAAGPLQAETAPPHPVAARYEAPTDRYPHNIMGRLRAHGEMVVETAACAGCPGSGRALRLRLPEALVFEDFAPRLADLDGDGRAEVITVESHRDRGSRLTAWEVAAGPDGPLLRRAAATGFIGQRFRWLAPIGAADFDGDGGIEFAYVEKPHLTRVLRLVRRQGDRLVPVAALEGVTNHAIGQEQPESRIEACPAGPVILALSGDGARAVAIGFAAGAPVLRDLGPVRGARLPRGLSGCPG
jgi:hypothetical protein